MAALADGRLAYCCAAQLPSRFYGPLPQVDRFKDFGVYRVLDDGAVACSPALRFAPLDAPELTWGAQQSG